MEKKLIVENNLIVEVFHLTLQSVVEKGQPTFLKQK